MKARNIYTLVARDITTDAQDQMTSILKIVDGLNAEIDIKDMPDSGNALTPHTMLLPVTYSVGTSWQFESPLEAEQELKLKLDLSDPSGKSLGGPEQEYNVPKGIDKINLNLNMQGFPYTKNGTYEIKTKLFDARGLSLAEGKYLIKAEIQIIE